MCDRRVSSAGSAVGKVCQYVWHIPVPFVFYKGTKLPIPSSAPTTVGTTFVLLPALAPSLIGPILLPALAPSLIIGPIGGAGCLLHPTVYAAAVKIPRAAPLHPSISIPPS